MVRRAGFFLFFFLSLSLTSESRPQNIVTRMELKYRAAKTLQATFLERYAENGRVVRSEAGTAYFRRPGKMRWQYESPEKNVFLVDGKTAWFYVPDDHTVTRVPAKNSADWRTPLALLAGEMKLSRVCAHVEPARSQVPESTGDAMLSCVLRGTDVKSKPSTGLEPGSKSPGGGDAVFFEVSQATGELVRVLVQGSGGVEIEFKFTNWQFDPPVSKSLFQFEIPPGVAIVNGELPAENKALK